MQKKLPVVTACLTIYGLIACGHYTQLADEVRRRTFGSIGDCTQRFFTSRKQICRVGNSGDSSGHWKQGSVASCRPQYEVANDWGNISIPSIRIIGRILTYYTSKLFNCRMPLCSNSGLWPECLCQSVSYLLPPRARSLLALWLQDSVHAPTLHIANDTPPFLTMHNNCSYPASSCLPCHGYVSGTGSM